jgi:predicted nucleic acid-binding protein
MSYLVDSDLIIDFLRNRLQAISLFKRIYSEDIKISIASWIEVMYGIKKSKIAGQKQLYQFQLMIENPRVNILPLEEKIASEFVSLKLRLEKRGLRLEDFDLLIAATAVAHNLILATGNKKHFSRIPGLKLL